LAVAEENVALSAAHAGAGGAYAWATRGYLLIAAGRAEEGLESARRGYDLLRPDEHDWRFAILKYLAIGYGATGRFDEGVALLEPHLANLDAMNNPLDAGQMCGVMANLQVSALRPLEALHMLDRQFAYAQRSGVLNERVATQNNQHTALLMVGDMLGALRAAQGARRDAETDLPQCAALHQQACAWEAVAKIGLGQFGEALQALEALQQAIAPLPPAEPIRAAVDEALGQLWLHLGDAARARQVLASVPLSSRPPKRRPFLQILSAQAALQLSAVRPRDSMADEADRLLREALALASTLHQEQAELRIRLVMGEQSDDPGAHLDAARAVLARAHRAGMPPFMALAAHHVLKAARSLFGRGGADRASLREAAEQALQLAQSTASPMWSRPNVLLTCAAGFADVGDGSLSRTCAERAQTEIDRIASTLPEALRRAYVRRNAEKLRAAL
jgi:tetratricopeptide (TPR) repeat protein